MSGDARSESAPRYGPFFRIAWAVLAVLSPFAVLWAFWQGDPNGILFGFGVVLASWSAVADAELALPERARGLTGLTLVLGIVAAVVGQFVAPFGA